MGMLFKFQKGTLAETWPRILAATAVSLVATYLVVHRGYKGLTLSPTPFTILGVAISIFLGFRNTTAYNRFWEARQQWGALVNTSRSFARQMFTLVGPLPGAPDDGFTPEEVDAFRRGVVLHVIAYVHALRHHLRGEDPLDGAATYLPPDEIDALRRYKNVPVAILQTLAERLYWARQHGWINEFHVPLLEENLTDLTNIQGACERIKNTPIPLTYSVLSHRLVAFFCFALPFGLAETVGDLTPVVTFLVSHAFFGLDVIGEEVEEPFGTDPHDLPLTQLSRMIEVNLLQMLGDHDALPDIPQPIDGVLL
jgi:putative membrane protein